MNSIFVIPARAGSKGLPGKNARLLNGIPLIFYSLDIARKFVNDDRICVSTNDPLIIEILKKERNYTAPFIRPDFLATDTAGTFDVLLHALDFYNNKSIYLDSIILLQPTSPLRTKIDIDNALKVFAENDVDMVVSVKETKANPYFTLFEEDASGFLKQSKSGSFIRRQDAPKVYEYNGAIYIMKKESVVNNSKMTDFNKIVKYVMSDMNSIDIDTALDWDIAEMLIKERNRLKPTN